IPRVVILDENAVYAHFMRRLNNIWMQRVKVGRKLSEYYEDL
ncbi:unnamed protein product, partial [Discosporangium mesarthrocarpum]